ncbi:GHKL domain-containing protein [Evansella sp. AB-P1]|uniref:sensor histidine kinase n=1 Tax=Evansella sp. AB-P1 TaxID=3037653 RepID=UPI00241C399C|nr:GHKL domain-containing protein [Evansella sp. AB-P1]MDG5785900.1 GHKL domain-containing protein [Evansella sp. AB-P1]
MNIITVVLIVLIQLLLVFMAIISIVVLKDDVLDIIGIPIHLIFVVLLNVISLYILGKIYKREEKRKVYNAELTHIQEFRSLVASVRSERHDLNNHLTVISGLMKINNYDAANKYIQDMIGDIRINSKALTIKNPTLASILYSKMDKYQREMVPFEVNITNEEIVTVISSTDLIRLISNLLDNAYEATVELPIEDRKIQLEIHKVNEKVKISVQNTSILNEITENHFKQGYSTKANSDRGYGLAIVQEITGKYNGSLVISSNDSLIIFEITFPMGLEK